VTAERILNKESNELEKKQAFSVIRNHKNDEKLNTVLDIEKNDFYNYEEKALKKPAILFPADFFLEDVFGDCSISEKAFNIMILTKTEKDLFVQIRNRNVKEVELLSESDKMYGYEITQKVKELTGKCVVDYIKNQESKYQDGLEDMYTEVSDKLLKGMRRMMPITRQKFDWSRPQLL
jgi:hypothetical protein